MSSRRAARVFLLAGMLPLLLAACAPLRPGKAPADERDARGVPWASVTTLPAPTTTEPAAPVISPVRPTVEPPAAAKEARPPPDDVERLLSYFERLKRLPGGEVAKEHEAARLAHGRAASEFNRISYAMTLALPGTAFNDDARALELLNPLVKKSDNSLRPLVVLLTTFIQERRRLGGDLAAVQQKLDALKSLERTLIERDQNNTGRK